MASGYYIVWGLVSAQENVGPIANLNHGVLTLQSFGDHEVQRVGESEVLVCPTCCLASVALLVYSWLQTVDIATVIGSSIQDEP